MSDEKNPNNKGPQGSENKTSPEPSGTKDIPDVFDSEIEDAVYFQNEAQEKNTGENNSSPPDTEKGD